MSSQVHMLSQVHMSSQVHELHIKYPDHVFVIIQTTSAAITIHKRKFITAYDVSFGQFMQSIRKNEHVILSRDQSIVGFIGNIVPPPTMSMGRLYSRYKGNDYILYITIETESVFG
jgi:flagellar basal body P-ring protein FlgI